MGSGSGRRSRFAIDREIWRARIRDAVHFADGPKVQPLNTQDLTFRGLVLTAVLISTALLLALMSLPMVAVADRTVGSIASKFDTPLQAAELPQFAQRSVIVDRKGKHIATLAGVENRVVMSLEDIPEHVQQAVLAVEDAKFYSHKGVDPAGLMRALLSNIRAGGLREGGSTITQQLVKNTIVGTSKTLERKVEEARLAVEIEKRMTKAQILELYLNEAYFGSGAYGVGAAAELFFRKKPAKLTLAEAALLAGIIKAPESFHPVENPPGARARRAVALERMKDEGFITADQAKDANAEPLPAKTYPLPKARVPYFVEYVKQELFNDRRFGDTRAERENAVFNAGLRIETTLDLSKQSIARKATDSVLDRKDDPASALVSIDATTGEVIAMVGGRNFDEAKYNLATQGKRQPGSTFKPFTMIAALMEGDTVERQFDTPSPLKIRDTGTGKMIEVNNYDEKPRGWIDMRKATEQSVNTYYMQLIRRVGADKVAEVARSMGIRSELKAVDSLSLGTEVVSPFELTSAYATIANQGVYCRPFAITTVTDAHGDVIVRNEPDCERRISADVAAAATDVLRGVITRGTGKANGQIGRAAGGKTGTTDNYADSWFAGFSRQYATVVWMGFPESTERKLHNIHGLERVFGGSLPAKIWSKYMRNAHSGLKFLSFPKPPAIPSVAVPTVTGEDVADATTTLDEAGFSVRVVEVPSGKRKGRVLRQDPAPETSIPKGGLVTIEVSTGSNQPAPSPTPSPSPTPTPTPTPSPTPSPTKTKKN